MRLLLIVWAVALSNATAPEPAMLEVERSGMCGLWRVAIYSYGFAHELVSDACRNGISESSTLQKVSRAQLKTLRDVVGSARFETLPDSIEPSTVQTDEDVLTIWWRAKSGMKKVDAYGLERARDKELAERFLMVWKAVADVVPEPSD